MILTYSLVGPIALEFNHPTPHSEKLRRRRKRRMRRCAMAHVRKNAPTLDRQQPQIDPMQHQTHKMFDHYNQLLQHYYNQLLHHHASQQVSIIYMPQTSLAPVPLCPAIDHCQPVINQMIPTPNNIYDNYTETYYQ